MNSPVYAFLLLNWFIPKTFQDSDKLSQKTADFFHHLVLDSRKSEIFWWQFWRRETWLHFIWSTWIQRIFFLLWELLKMSIYLLVFRAFLKPPSHGFVRAFQICVWNFFSSITTRYATVFLKLKLKHFRRILFINHEF